MAAMISTILCASTHFPTLVVTLLLGPCQSGKKSYHTVLTDFKKLLVFLNHGFIPCLMQLNVKRISRISRSETEVGWSASWPTKVT